MLWTDVAPRDGLQNVKSTIPTEAKIRLVRGLLDAGVPRVEATAFVSPRWVPQLADAAAVIDGVRDALTKLRVLIPNARGLELDRLGSGAGRGLHHLAKMVHPFVMDHRLQTTQTLTPGRLLRRRLQRPQRQYRLFRHQSLTIR